jgi:isoquinoline 1-oxidoreductase alpha subunit
LRHGAAAAPCTVHVDGVGDARLHTPISVLAGKKIVTIEGIGATPQGKAMQNGLVERERCPMRLLPVGQIMSAAALLAKTPKPKRLRTSTLR